MASTAEEDCNAYITQMVPDANHRQLMLNALSRIVKASTRRVEGIRVYVFKGTGNNGKSTFMEFIRQTVGDAGVLVTEETLTSSLTTTLMDTISHKQLLFVEVANLSAINSLMKVLMSGNRVTCPVVGTANRKEYAPKFDIIICTSSSFKPHPQHVVTIPFELEFVDTPNPQNSKQHQKRSLSSNFSQWSPIFKQKLINGSYS